jgi:hypothetical protein
MKRLVLFLGMLLFATFTYAQKEIVQVNFNEYEMTEVLSDNLTQIGYFKSIDGKLIKGS